MFVVPRFAGILLALAVLQACGGGGGGGGSSEGGGVVVNPGTGSPGTGTPGAGTPPTTGTPGTETPGTGAPGNGTPGTETPGTGSPGTETPGTGSPGSGTPPTRGPGDLQVPALFTLLLPENSGTADRNSQNFLFKLVNEDDDLSYGVLSGPDAALFNIVVTIPIAPPPVTVQVRVAVRPLVNFDYEAPVDQDRDNVYEFSATFRYNDEIITRPFRITVQDALDFPHRYYQLTDADAALLYAVPDLTGDGKSEVAISNRSNRTSVSDYLIMSEDLLDPATGQAPIGALAGRRSAFTQTVFDDYSRDVYRFMSQSHHSPYRRLSAVTGAVASGGRVDVLASNSSDNRFALFRTTPGAANPLLTGTIDLPTTAIAKTTYTNASTTHHAHAELLGDIDGDGYPEAFVSIPRKGDVYLGGDGKETYGIVFGKATPTTLDIGQGADALLRYTSAPPEVTQNPPRVMLVPDADGDGRPDLVITYMNYTGPDGNPYMPVIQSAIWMIKSSALTRGAVIDLENLTAAQGVMLKGTTDQLMRFSFPSMLGDYDNDGRRTLAFSARDSVRGLACFIDTDDFARLPVASTVTEFRSGGGKCFAPAYPSTSVGAAYDAGDLDGDGVRDVVLVNSLNLVSKMTFMSGQQVRSALAGSAPVATVGTPLAELRLNTTSGLVEPLFLEDSQIFVAAAGRQVLVIPRSIVLQTMAAVSKTGELAH